MVSRRFRDEIGEFDLLLLEDDFDEKLDDRRCRCSKSRFARVLARKNSNNPFVSQPSLQNSIDDVTDTTDDVTNALRG